MHPLYPRHCGTKGLPQGCAASNSSKNTSGSGISDKKPAASQNSAKEAQGSSSSVRTVTIRSAAFAFASSLWRMYSASFIGHCSTVVAVTFYEIIRKSDMWDIITKVSTIIHIHNLIDFVWYRILITIRCSSISWNLTQIVQTLDWNTEEV